MVADGTMCGVNKACLDTDCLDKGYVYSMMVSNKMDTKSQQSVCIHICTNGICKVVKKTQYYSQSAHSKGPVTHTITHVHRTKNEDLGQCVVIRWARVTIR